MGTGHMLPCKNIKIGAMIWFRHDHIVISHISCPTTTWCELFKPFKTIFRKERDNAMVRENHCELNKIAFANWVEKVVNTSLRKKC